jgi:hypothetical protein
MVGIPLLLFFFNYSRSANKTLCLFLEPDKSVTQGLLPHDEDFVYDRRNGNAYYIFPERVRFVRFPSGWPIFLQQTVPMVLYERGNGEPLEWTDLGKRTVSSKEVGAAMEPKWLTNIIKGASELQGESRMGKMLPLLSLAGVLMCMVLVFVLMTKIGALQTAVEGIKLLK